MTSASATKPKQGRGRSNSLPKPVVEYLKNWLWDHKDHPYPTDQEKAQMVQDTGLELTRLNNWFVNNRIRYWKPRMEALQRKQKQGDKKEEQQDKTRHSTTSSTASTTSTSSITNTVSKKRHSSTPDFTLLDAAVVTPTTTQKLTLFANATWAEAIRKLAPETATTTTNSSSNNNDFHIVSDISLGASSEEDEESTQRRLARKRSSNTEMDSPRTKFSRQDAHLWRHSCQTSPQLHDLPTLDEAALLFGFATQQK